MSFETAFRLKDPHVLRLLERTILKIADQHSVIRGTEILWRIEQDIGQPIGTGIIYDLIEGGVLIKRRSSKSIEDYIFEVEREKIEKYFDRETIAAEIIQCLDRKMSATSPLLISFAATVPEIYADAAEGFEEIYPALIRIAAEATHDLWIINPFFDDYGAQCLIPSLIGAAKNGVNIRILGRRIYNPQNQEFNKSVVCVSAAFFKEDLVNRIEIRDFFRQDDSGKLIYGLHTKMMIADEHMAYIGSANITRYSLRNNFEIGVILKGKGIEPLLAITSALWTQSTTIDPRHCLKLED